MLILKLQKSQSVVGFFQLISSSAPLNDEVHHNIHTWPMLLKENSKLKETIKIVESALKL